MSKFKAFKHVFKKNKKPISIKKVSRKDVKKFGGGIKQSFKTIRF